MAGPNIYHEQQADLSAGNPVCPSFFVSGRAVLLDHTGIVLLAAAAVSLPVHEALHGLGWKLGGRLGRGQVSLIFRHGMPMCTCRAVLPVRAYLTGTLLPFIVLGGGSFIYLVACPGTVSLLTALVNLTLPGAGRQPEGSWICGVVSGSGAMTMENVNVTAAGNIIKKII